MTTPKPSKSPLEKLLDLILTTDRHRRVRLQQWLTILLVYLFSIVLLGMGVQSGLLDGRHYASWITLVLIGLAFIHVLLRTGWSERFQDKAMTSTQIIFAVITVLYGYTMGGPVRSTALFPMLFIFMFGAFSLTWRRLVALSIVALAGLLATILLLHATQPGQHDIRLDTANFLALMVLLPACVFITAKISHQRLTLHRQRSDLSSALSEVERLATRDDLTGLVNRRAMQEIMANELLRSQRSGEPFCLAMIDLDYFKRVNDVYGHAAGDLVLKGFAEQGLKVIRGLDTLARWGGEEFLLIMSETSLEAAAMVMDRMRERLATHPFNLGTVSLTVTLSAGLAEHIPGEDINDTLGRADAGVYKAKASGRNRVERG